MTSSNAAIDSLPEPVKSEERSLSGLVSSLARDLDEVLSSGDVAELRRMRPDDPGCAAYWKLVAGRFEPRGALPESGPLREESERRWAVILAAMARLRGLHRPGLRLGRVLAEHRVAEPRVLRLLRARGEALEDAVRLLAHQLSSAGAVVDCTDLARLVLSDGRSDETAVRRRIARDFFSSSTTA